MAITKVKQGEIIKTSLLLGVLVSLPKTIYLYNGIMDGNLDFSITWVVDFLYRFFFFFCFAWSVIQLNANIDYEGFKWPALLKWMVIATVNLALLFMVIFLIKTFYPFINGRPLEQREEGWIDFTFINLSIVLFFIARLLRVSADKQDSRIENEQLKQQNLENELSALKNQIDPHFLFNSLNSLTSLIRENEKATQFVKKLSYMYRYILQSSDTNLVQVKEELKFLESYSFLMETRYRDRLNIQIDIDASLLERELPPLALQSLVENSVKHNEISSTNPLTVKVYSKGESIFIENPIRSRSTLAEGTGTGLMNLKKRYALLLKHEIKVSTDNDIFKVELPLNHKV
ncbi:histidine kinase [uncultured Maribacter sp.]|mgnify:FL=1|uniref:sensor histidine kinase n=1 Tax=uncultured Maribacter sp. TaxID=431308 RepID=UPI0030D892F2|tara:strand:- start:1200 stop:2234 length:1035 start_codon:yes stop_codon:yes gene_type:complete